MLFYAAFNIPKQYVKILTSDMVSSPVINTWEAYRSDRRVFDSYGAYDLGADLHLMLFNETSQFYLDELTPFDIIPRGTLNSMRGF